MFIPSNLRSQTEMPPTVWNKTLIPPQQSAICYRLLRTLCLCTVDLINVRCVSTPPLFKMISVGDYFSSMEAARMSITTQILDNMRAYKVQKADSKRYVLVCTNGACTFRVWVATHLKPDQINVLVCKPHTCGPPLYYKSKLLHRVSYLKAHHRARVLANLRIRPGKSIPPPLNTVSNSCSTNLI